MATKATASGNIEVKAAGLINGVPRGGSQIPLYEVGLRLHEEASEGSPIDVVLDDGTKVTGTIRGVQIGALIDLMSSGMPSPMIQPQGLQQFRPREIVRRLTKASGADMIDVTKTYSMVFVEMPIEAAPAPQPPLTPGVAPVMTAGSQ